MEIKEIETPVGKLSVRGKVLMVNGDIRSCEPSKPQGIETSIGQVMGYDTNYINGLEGNGSLVFDEGGFVISMITSTDRINVMKEGKKVAVYEPVILPNLMTDEEDEVQTVKVEFEHLDVVINGDRYNLLDTTFEVIKQVVQSKGCPTGEDNHCGACCGGSCSIKNH